MDLANGFSEYITGRDIFGNPISEEEQQAGFERALLLLPFRGKNATPVLGVKNDARVVSKGIPSYGKKSVPIGPYRVAHGFPVKIKSGAQEKHIPNTPNYKQEIANGKNKSIFYGDNKTAQELLDQFSGKGLTVTKNKERVDFGKAIGKYYNRDTGEYLETTKGMIHYGKDGAHIVPSRP